MDQDQQNYLKLNDTVNQVVKNVITRKKCNPVLVGRTCEEKTPTGEEVPRRESQSRRNKSKKKKSRRSLTRHNYLDDEVIDIGIARGCRKPIPNSPPTSNRTFDFGSPFLELNPKVESTWEDPGTGMKSSPPRAVKLFDAATKNRMRALGLSVPSSSEEEDSASAEADANNTYGGPNPKQEGALFSFSDHVFSELSPEKGRGRGGDKTETGIYLSPVSPAKCSEVSSPSPERVEISSEFTADDITEGLNENNDDDDIDIRIRTNGVSPPRGLQLELCDGEEWQQCPYDKSHKHLWPYVNLDGCRERYRKLGKDKRVCPRLFEEKDE